MWKEFTPEGNLQYQFLQTVTNIRPMYILRGIGGTLYITGVFIMVYNVYKTVKAGKFIPTEWAEAPPLGKGIYPEKDYSFWHSWIERRPIQLLVLSLVVVSIGGIVQMVPTFLIKSNIPTISSVKPYTPLELEGRDLYLREGCYTCHSQMVRPFRDEVARYGEYSKAGEFVYDHPFQWGSKRTGPDLHRIGGKYSNAWHFNHMLQPTSMSPGSLMPNYPWLLEKDLDLSLTEGKIRAMQTMGVPYPKGYDQQAVSDLKKQAGEITQNLKDNKIRISVDKEIIAMIAYLQRLGTDIKGEKKETVAIQ
jgi:cytochrome c oxidase cbb3-type subunit I/II